MYSVGRQQRLDHSGEDRPAGSNSAWTDPRSLDRWIGSRLGSDTGFPDGVRRTTPWERPLFTAATGLAFSPVPVQCNAGLISRSQGFGARDGIRCGNSVHLATAIWAHCCPRQILAV